MRFSNQVQAVLEAEGISNQEFETMVRRAARITHERGNWRYHDWVMRINYGKVETLQALKLKRVAAGGQANLLVVEKCPECAGDGCAKCGWVGKVELEYKRKSIKE